MSSLDLTLPGTSLHNRSMTATQFPVPKEDSMKFQVGDKVTTEYGSGVVEESSHRRVFIRLDDGDAINVAVGTYGYGRIVMEEVR